MTENNHVNTKLNGVNQIEGLIAVNRAAPSNVPESTLAKIGALNDRWIYRMTVGVLGAVMLIGCIGAIILQFSDKAIPDILLSLGSGRVAPASVSSIENSALITLSATSRTLCRKNWRNYETDYQ